MIPNACQKGGLPCAWLWPCMLSIGEVHPESIELIRVLQRNPGRESSLAFTPLSFLAAEGRASMHHTQDAELSSPPRCPGDGCLGKMRPT